jgi:hypothetical protein
LFWFLDAGNDETLGRLSWPASKKRQGTKLREVGHPAVQQVLGKVNTISSCIVGVQRMIKKQQGSSGRPAP